MVRRLGICLCLAAIAGFIIGPAYAAVQNVKVGGDIKAMAVSRSDFDFSNTRGDNATANNEASIGAGASFARVRVDADLTDNVATTIRLLNERLWGQEAAAGSADDSDIDLDLASVTLKEFLYSPLTLTVGRQELKYGSGLIVGDPDTNITSVNAALGSATLIGEGIRDLSLRKAFDAVKAVFDYNPLVIDAFFARTDADNVVLNANTDLYGLNLRYDTGIKNTIVEGYYFGKMIQDGAAYPTATPTVAPFANSANTADKTHTLGARISTDPIENLNLQLEGALQFGTYNPNYDVNASGSGITGTISSTTAEIGRRRAWALQAIADYKFKVKYDPRIIATYSFYSGEKNNRTSGKYNGWNPMYEDQTLGDITNAIFTPSNAHVVTVTGMVKPAEDLSLDVTYLYMRAAEKIQSGGNYVVAATGPNKPSVVLSGINTAATSYLLVAGKRDLGHEIDAHLNYNYTEDVQIGVGGGVFIPGKAFAEPTNRDAATQATASVKVTF